MSTETNGIATASDVNSVCRNSFIQTSYGDYLTKCPTKQQILKSSNGVRIANSDSYLDNQLVKYEDIHKVRDHEITVVVWNNKNIASKLDTIEVQYATSSTATSGTGMGSLSIGNVSSEETYSISFTLPSDFGSKAYYFRVICGQTDSNQTWSYKTNLDSSYIACESSKIKTGYTKWYPITPNSSTQDSLLGTYNGGGSKITAIYFQIQT